MPKALDSSPVSGDDNMMFPVTTGNLKAISDAALRAKAAEALRVGKIVWANARGFLRVDDPRPAPTSKKL